MKDEPDFLFHRDGSEFLRSVHLFLSLFFSQQSPPRLPEQLGPPLPDALLLRQEVQQEEQGEKERETELPNISVKNVTLEVPPKWFCLLFLHQILHARVPLMKKQAKQSKRFQNISFHIREYASWQHC